MKEDTNLAHLLLQSDPDHDDRPAVATRVRVIDSHLEQPVHSHRKGQLVVSLHGGVTCEVPDALWIAPPHYGVWVPGGVDHRSRATDNAQICFLLIEPGALDMPAECCTVKIAPMIREMIQHLVDQGLDYPRNGRTARLVSVLLEQLSTAPVEHLKLPISQHPKLQLIAQTFVSDCSNRLSLMEWADRMAMSEKTLARLVVRETGLTFGRWRQRFKLLLALQLLASGMTVQRVAGDLGYDSVTAFITMFKKALGVSPGKYFSDPT
ncbi:AraC family transcriptional regulator [Pseudomonas putida]|nr:AraC family transcriptional regulator [Pseudomonas putida]